MSTINTNQTGPPQRRYSQSTRSTSQNLQVIDYCKTYGIEPEQISFDGDFNNPIFDFDALCTLVTKLTDFQEVIIEMTEAREGIDQSFAISQGEIVMANGRKRKGFGACLVGEILHDGNEVTTLGKAMEISRARALRVVLRMADFDPVRAHHQHLIWEAATESMKGGVRDQNPTVAGRVERTIEDLRNEEQQRIVELRQIHALAHEFGLIDGDNKGAYYQIIDKYFPGVRSAQGMSGSQRAQFIAMLRAWIKAKGVAVDLNGSERDAGT